MEPFTDLKLMFTFRTRWVEVTSVEPSNWISIFPPQSGLDWNFYYSTFLTALTKIEKVYTFKQIRGHLYPPLEEIDCLVNDTSILYLIKQLKQIEQFVHNISYEQYFQLITLEK